MKTFTSPIYFLITMTLVASGLIENPAYGATKSKVGQFKTAGRATTSGASNTILSGVAAPKTTLGINGDFYIDTKALTLYGPKVGGKWPTPFSLRGATGGPGIAGANGADARVVTNASSVAGPPGPIGARGEVGAKGATGATGDSGATGAAGSSGSQGSIGATGPAGVAGAQGSIGATGGAGVAGSNGTNGTQGAKGDTGNTGAKGDVGDIGQKGNDGIDGAKGDTGITGAKGDVGDTGTKGDAGTVGVKGDIGTTGAVGAAGPSSVTTGAISFPAVIQGVLGSSQTSSAFGTFLNGSSYIVRFRVETYNATKDISTYPLVLTVSAVGGSPTVTTSYSVVNGSYWRSGATQNEVIVLAESIISSSGSSGTFDLSITVACQAVTTLYPVTLSGTYSRTLVGQVG